MKGNKVLLLFCGIIFILLGFVFYQGFVFFQLKDENNKFIALENEYKILVEEMDSYKILGSQYEIILSDNNNLSNKREELNNKINSLNNDIKNLEIKINDINKKIKNMS